MFSKNLFNDVDAIFFCILTVSRFGVSSVLVELKTDVDSGLKRCNWINISYIVGLIIPSRLGRTQEVTLES